MKQTAVEQLIYDLRNIDMSIFNEEHCKKYLEIEKEQSLKLIELTAQLTGVASVDDEIAKMEYVDVYNHFYNNTYGK